MTFIILKRNFVIRFPSQKKLGQTHNQPLYASYANAYILFENNAFLKTLETVKTEIDVEFTS